jgi:hypothetical protein
MTGDKFYAPPQQTVIQNVIGITNNDWPFVVFLAGLPAIRDADRISSYFERAEWHELGALDPAATLRALTVPAPDAGRPFAIEAAEHLAEQTGGYPYAIQLYGPHAWRASEGQSRITLQAASAAERTASVELARGSTPSAALRPPPVNASPRRNCPAPSRRRQLTGAEVAKRLGRTTKQLGPHRTRLIRKGTLNARGDELFFTVPAWAPTSAASRGRTASGRTVRSAPISAADGSLL